MSIEPQPIHIIDSETKIIDGLKAMKEKSLTYLLLQNKEQKITGIFTKTDLLNLLINIDKDSNALQRPFHQLMTKPLKTLPLQLIHTAPEFMKSEKINHRQDG